MTDRPPRGLFRVHRHRQRGEGHRDRRPHRHRGFGDGAGQRRAGRPAAAGAAKAESADQAREAAVISRYCGLCAAATPTLAGFGRYGRPSRPWRAQCPCPNPPRKPSRIPCFPPRWPKADPEIARRDRAGARPPARRDRADRLGEHRQPRGAGGAGLGADQQVRRRPAGPALLRRLPVRRHRRDAGDRPGQEAVRRRASPTCSRTPARPPMSRRSWR